MLLTIFIVFSLFFNNELRFSEAAELPSNFIKCSSSKPNFNNCTGHGMEMALKLMKNGIPSLKILPLDPLEVTSINIYKADSGPVSGSLDLKNVHVYGLSTASIIALSNGIRNGNLTLKGDSFVTQLQLISDYQMEAKAFIVPVSGSGRCNVTMSNVDIGFKIQFEIVKKGGEEYLKVIKYILTYMRPKQLFMKFDDLFGDNLELARQMHVLINEKSLEIFQEFKPAVLESFGELYKEVANQLFLQVPYKSIFLD